MLDGLDYNIPSVTRKYWLFCGDNWLVWMGPSETFQGDDHDPKRTLGEVFGRGAYPTDFFRFDKPTCHLGIPLA